MGVVKRYNGSIYEARSNATDTFLPVLDVDALGVYDLNREDFKGAIGLPTSGPTDFFNTHYHTWQVRQGTVVSGRGSVTAGTSTTSHLGVVVLSLPTGTSAGNIIKMSTEDNTPVTPVHEFCTFSKTLLFEAYVQIPTLFAAGSNFEFVAGIGTTNAVLDAATTTGPVIIGTDATIGFVGFAYTQGTSAWRAVCRKNTTTNTVTTTTASTVTTSWVNLKFTYTGSVGAENVQFYIDNALVATHSDTTKLPIDQVGSAMFGLYRTTTGSSSSTVVNIDSAIVTHIRRIGNE